jgi:hypothetical protein
MNITVTASDSSFTLSNPLNIFYKLEVYGYYCYSINDISSFNLERIITVKGSIENMSKAEGMISSKLRQSYENDLQAMAVSCLPYCAIF